MKSALAPSAEHDLQTYLFRWLYCYCRLGCDGIMKRPGVFLPLDGTSYGLLESVSSKIGEHSTPFEYAPSCSGGSNDSLGFAAVRLCARGYFFVSVFLVRNK